MLFCLRGLWKPSLKSKKGYWGNPILCLDEQSRQAATLTSEAKYGKRSTSPWWLLPGHRHDTNYSYGNDLRCSQHMYHFTSCCSFQSHLNMKISPGPSWLVTVWSQHFGEDTVEIKRWQLIMFSRGVGDSLSSLKAGYNSLCAKGSIMVL